MSGTQQRRVALIGTGEMAKTHTAAWQALGADVLVHSRSPERGTAFAAAHGVTAVSDLAQILQAAEIIDICTPTDTHADLTHRAAEAGLHVVCEKPLARDPAEGRAMIEACERAGVGLCVAQVLRFFPAYLATRDAIAAGRIGTPREFRFFRQVESPGAETWFADTERSGGVLVDLAIHDIDFARWVGGEVTEVVGRSTLGLQTEPPIRASATLTHARGLTSQIIAVWDVPGTPLRSTFELVGDEGVLRFASLPDPVVTDGSGAVVFAEDGSVDPFAEQLREFVAAFDGKGQPRVTAEDGLMALTIALAATRSAEVGQSVDPSSLLA